MNRLCLGVVGAGLVGRRHIGLVRAHPSCELAAVVEPEPGVADALAREGVPVHATIDDMLSQARPHAVILASPNACHVEQGLQCIDAGIPVLVEKPIATTVAEGEALVTAAESTGVPLLVGHHRRHSPILRAACDVVRSGLLGRLVAVTGSALFAKPDTYFQEAPWRREPGGGPILINLIHEVDNLRAMCGDITEVQAVASNHVREFAVEDTAAITLRFASGAVGTFLLSDAAASVRSWEQTAREDPVYPGYDDEDCYLLAGTSGSLSVPTMRLRVARGNASWRTPLDTSVVQVDRGDPWACQLDHFLAVVRNGEAPVVSGREGLRSLRVTLAVAEAAATGRSVSTTE